MVMKTSSLQRSNVLKTVLLLLIACVGTVVVVTSNSSSNHDSMMMSNPALDGINNKDVVSVDRKKGPLTKLLANVPILIIGRTGGGIVNNLVRPVVLEVGALVVCQSIGMPIFVKLIGMPLQRLLLLTTSRSTSKVINALRRAENLKILQHSSKRLWKSFTMLYTRISGTKFANRGKKYLYPFVNKKKKAKAAANLQ